MAKLFERRRLKRFRSDDEFPSISPLKSLEGAHWFDSRGCRLEDPYLALGVAPGAAEEAIRSRYHEAVRAHPPERDPDAFKRLTTAYQLLTRVDQRLTLRFGAVPPLPVHLLPKPAVASRRFEDELLFYALLHSLPMEAISPPAGSLDRDQEGSAVSERASP